MIIAKFIIWFHAASSVLLVCLNQFYTLPHTMAYPGIFFWGGV